MRKLRSIAVVLSMLGAAVASAGTLTITEPAAGTSSNPTLIGKNAKIKFNIAGGVNKVNLRATIRKFSNNEEIGVRTAEATPDSDGKASGEINLGFAENVTEEVTYRVIVTATDINNATTYSSRTLFVLPDLTRPKILQFNPTEGLGVKGIVPITVRILEPNLKDWRIQINNEDIPNNTGETVDANREFTVNWNTSALLADAEKTINIRLRDKADNETTLNVTVFVDRKAPTVSFASPRSGTTVSPGTTINVAIDIGDFSSDTLDVSGVDVVVRDTSGRFIARVARVSFNASGNGRRWVGRIRWRAGLLPSTFRITASVLDKAGNAATPQTVTLRLGR